MNLSHIFLNNLKFNQEKRAKLSTCPHKQTTPKSPKQVEAGLKIRGQPKQGLTNNHSYITHMEIGILSLTLPSIVLLKP